jgi:cell division initiation protein
MRMTPLQIKSHRFARQLRGYDREEVDSFLSLATDDYASVLMENESHRNRLRMLEERLTELTTQEQLLKLTLLNAQSMSEKLRQSAQKECDLLLNEAEFRAQRIVEAAHRRAGQLHESIREMQGLRTTLAASLRSSIATHLGLVENLMRDSIELEPHATPRQARVVTEHAQQTAPARSLAEPQPAQNRARPRTQPPLQTQPPPAGQPGAQTQPPGRPRTQAQANTRPEPRTGAHPQPSPEARPQADRRTKPGEPALSRFKPGGSTARLQSPGPAPTA